MLHPRGFAKASQIDRIENVVDDVDLTMFALLLKCSVCSPHNQETVNQAHDNGGLIVWFVGENKRDLNALQPALCKKELNLRLHITK